MVNVRAPIFLRLGNRGRDMDTPAAGTLRNVIISNVVAAGAKQACPIAGLSGHAIQNVTLDNIQMAFAGGGTVEQTNVSVPEEEGKYPEATMFGVLPSYGLYCRHVEGLRLRNLHLTVQTPDHRHALVCDDVSHLVIDSLEADRSSGAESSLRFRGVRRVVIGNCLLPEPMSGFLKVMDGGMKEVRLIGNEAPSGERDRETSRK
jgi:hypothetical protein